MNIKEAVSICLKKYFVAKGRASRSEYFLFVGAIAIPLVILSFFSLMMVLLSSSEMGVGITLFWLTLVGLFFLLITFPLLMLTIRRLHDTNRSGWFVLLYLLIFIPYLGTLGSATLLFLVAQKSTVGENRYGSPPPYLKEEDTMGIRELLSMGFSKIFTLKGRASRSEYWVFLFVIMGLPFTLSDFFLLLPVFVWAPIFGILFLLSMLLSFAIVIRRLHDTNRSGWFVLLNLSVLIPFLGGIGPAILIFMLLQEGTAGENRYGPAPFSDTLPSA